MNLDSRVFRVVAWIAVVLAMVWVYQRVTGDIRVVPPDRAPAAGSMSMVGLDGAEVDLQGFRGRVVVLNLWASWCGPCRREIPSLNAVGERYADRGLVILGLNIDDDEPAAIADASRRLGVSYLVTRPTGALRGPFETAGVIPHTWLIDREGRVRASHSGVASSAAFDRACRILLEE